MTTATTTWLENVELQILHRGTSSLTTYIYSMMIPRKVLCLSSLNKTIIVKKGMHLLNTAKQHSKGFSLCSIRMSVFPHLDKINANHSLHFCLFFLQGKKTCKSGIIDSLLLKVIYS